MTIEAASEKLKKAGQEHVLKFYDDLDAAGKKALIDQIGETDFTICENADRLGEVDVRGVFSPLGAMQIPEIRAQESAFRESGLAALRDGRVGCVLLAGGMGTRLGSDNPKGMYDIGLTRPVYIFQRLIENLKEVVQEAGRTIPLFVMTSALNHEATVGFLQEKDFFGRVDTPWRVLTGKVITPSEEEVQSNPRSRSAKLRIAELVARQGETNHHKQP